MACSPVFCAGTGRYFKGRFFVALASLFTLATIFSFSLNVGSQSGPKFVVVSITLFDQTMTYDGLQLLLILGISIVAAVVVEKLAGRATPGGIFGAFLIALIGIWIFLTFIPLVWKGDYNIDGIPLITAVIGAIVSILVVHLLTGSFRKKAPAKA
jgi:uncharacterized membrane protein YeaQ/YmgE (transglycosylase-associated protein family)